MYFNGNQLLTFTTERKLLLGLRDYLQISTKKYKAAPQIQFYTIKI